MKTGRIHSIETFGTVDGPGIRYVVFTQGCPLRCKYCHNRDTWNIKDGKEISVAEIINDVKKYIPFMSKSNGGITLSGGEATLQPEFTLEILKEAKSLGIHTCLDTAGFIDIDKINPILEHVDLVLLDIKHIDNEKCIDLTGQGNSKTLALAKHLSEKNIPVWIRQVIVPGITNDVEDLNKLASFISTLKNVHRIELLPYHTMGVHKWELMNDEYPLKNVPDATSDDIDNALKVFETHNLINLIDFNRDN